MSGTTARAFHEGVTCNLCSRSNFRGRRYKCLNCYHYNLCQSCYDAGVRDHQFHEAEHAMQCVLTREDLELYYGGEEDPQQQSFTCPMCATMGFSLKDLGDHVWSKHRLNTAHVVCPACAVTSGAGPINLRGDLTTHLAFEHAAGPAHLQSLSASESLQRAARAGVLGNVPGFDRRLQPQRPSSTRSVQPASSPDTQSVGTLSGMLSQMSTAPHGASTLAGARATVAEIERVRTRLQIARQAFQRQVRFAPQGSRPALELPLEPSPEPAPEVSEPTSAEPPAPTEPRFLLSALIDPPLSDSQQQALESERANRSLFFQELLLSALSGQTATAAQEQPRDSQPAAAASGDEEEAAATGNGPSAAASFKKTAPTSPGSTESSTPTDITNPESTGVAGPDISPPSSVEPGSATSTEINARTTSEPTAATSSGHTATTPRPIAATPGHTQTTGDIPAAASILDTTAPVISDPDVSRDE